MKMRPGGRGSDRERRVRRTDGGERHYVHVHADRKPNLDPAERLVPYYGVTGVVKPGSGVV
jgi:hypothetical protein